MPPIASGLAAALATPFASVETILERSKEKFIQALLVDGSVMWIPPYSLRTNSSKPKPSTCHSLRRVTGLSPARLRSSA